MVQLDSMLAQAIQAMAVAAGVAALLVLLLTMPIVRRVTRPLRSVTESLTAIAEGRSDVEIDCHDRMDEIGEIARTIAVFKSNSAERRRLREEQTAAAVAAVEQRKSELRAFVDEFQTSVGGIIDNVLNSSGEFERVARQLTETARTTAGLSGQSASASETASEHVRAAAAASDELSSSISEITRRVQESNGIAAEAVKRIDVLFAIEREINGLAPQERLRVRQEHSRPLIVELEAWLRQQRAKLSKNNDTAKAINYSLTRWDAFSRFLDDGRLCMSNNAAERELRAVAVGRRNWTFAGSDEGGRRAAAIYTLVASAKLNDIDPQAWLADVLARLPDHPAKRIHELLPWNWRPQNVARAA